MPTTRAGSPLPGWYVISLRPSGQHAPLRRAAAAAGARLLPVSTMSLRALDAGPALATALACPLRVFTSPAAVRFAARQAPLRAAPGGAWLAVGGGTAAALRRAGVAPVHSPATGGDSEALLALPELQAMAGREVGLVTAPGGRGLITAVLQQRGARVHRADVYERVPRRPGAATLQALADLPATSALLVSSGEAFEGLWSALDADARRTLAARPAVASSARLAAMLAERGFGRLVLAAGARPAQLLSALAADVAAGRFR